MLVSHVAEETALAAVKKKKKAILHLGILLVLEEENC